MKSLNIKIITSQFGRSLDDVIIVTQRFVRVVDLGHPHKELLILKLEFSHCNCYNLILEPCINLTPRNQSMKK